MNGFKNIKLIIQIVTSAQRKNYLSFLFVSNLLQLTLEQNILYFILNNAFNQLVLKLEVDPLRPNYY